MKQSVIVLIERRLLGLPSHFVLISARLNSLSSFRSLLFDEIDLELHCYLYTPTQSLMNIISSHFSCVSCCSNCSMEIPQEPLHLIIITDDGLHPTTDAILSTLSNSNILHGDSKPHLCESCRAPLNLSTFISVEIVMSFDSLSIVPCRSLLSECQNQMSKSPHSPSPSSPSSNQSEELLKFALTRLEFPPHFTY
jgi:hypothetical protein